VQGTKHCRLFTDCRRCGWMILHDAHCWTSQQWHPAPVEGCAQKKSGSPIGDPD